MDSATHAIARHGMACARLSTLPVSVSHSPSIRWCLRHPPASSWQYCRAPYASTRWRSGHAFRCPESLAARAAALPVSVRALHTVSAPAPLPTSSAATKGVVETPETPSLLAAWLAKRRAAPVPQWAAHVPARRASTGGTDSSVHLSQPIEAGAVRTPARAVPAGHVGADDGAVDVRAAVTGVDGGVTCTDKSARAPQGGPDTPVRSAAPLEHLQPLSEPHSPNLKPASSAPMKGYVPLLYREGVLPPGSAVRLPALPVWMQPATTDAVSAGTSALAVGERDATVSAGERTEAVDMGDESVAELSPEAAADASHGVVSGLVSSSSRSAARGATGHTRTVILDPVSWLAQDLGAPLMDPEVLQTHITPSAFAGMAALYQSWEHSAELSSPASAAVPDEANSAHDFTPFNAHLVQASTSAAPSAQGVVVEQTNEGTEGADDVALPQLVDANGKGEGRASLAAAADAEQTLDTVVPSSLPAADSTAHEAARGDHSEAKDSLEGPLASKRRVASEPQLATLDSPRPAPIVYNVFTGRVAQATSTSISALALMGVGVNAETRQLTVVDAHAVNLLAHELRSGRVSWPTSWARGSVFHKAKALLADEAVLDPASQLEALLQQQYLRVRRRQQARGGVIQVAGETAGGEDSDAEAAQDSCVPARHLTIGGASRASELLTLADLNEEQQEVVEFVKRGYHTYIGGGAGTGKSVLLRVLRQELLKEGLTVAMTGTTGMAGWHVGGCTLHHCFGINLFGEFTRRKELAAYDVIIIDEVSMLSRQLFEALEYQLRRANGVEWPFGGVQIILCGDFLQLGAISAQPIVNSPVFRANFAMLKLKTVLRQDQHQLFSRQLDVLRRGKIPEGLQNTVQFLTAEEVMIAKEAERKRVETQLQQLRQVLDGVPPGGDTPSTASEDLRRQIAEKEDCLAHAAGMEANPPMVADSAAAVVPYVADAVNLLPTNAQVEARNQLELMKLKGDEVTFPALVMPPTTLGTWTPTCLLRITDRTGWARGEDITSDVGRARGPNAAAAALEKRLLVAVEQFLARFFITKPYASPQGEDVDEGRLQHAVSSWLSSLMTGSRNIVLYRLFTDAFVLRVRIPAEVGEMDAQAFVAHFQRLDDELLAPQPALGVRVREWIPTAEGLHTEGDEYTLAQYALRSPMSRGVSLKVGARVMLRTNLGPRHVNGSLGTVVGFRPLKLDELPRYLINNNQREEAVQAYADFLQLEHGMDQAIVPEVDFGDGHVACVPPVTFFVGGHANTHHYSTGIVALPLSLAYAFTVHKVQGLTLVGRVHLELSRMWPCEHLLYVAMSRVRNPEQLSVSSFSPRLVQASPECVLFDDSIPAVGDVKVLASFVPSTWRRYPSRRKRVVRRKQREAAERKKKQQLRTDSQGAAEGGGDGRGWLKKRLSKAAMNKEIQAIQEQLLAAQAPVS